MSLEKIANHESLSKDDIIAAANELVELEKQAADADAYGRELAHQYVAELVKQAEEDEKASEVKEEEEKKKKEMEKKEGEEKKSSDAALEKAIETLRKSGIIG